MSVDTDASTAGAARLASRVEWLVSAIALVTALAFHVLVFRNAGPLWRDEVNSLNLASLPSLRDIWPQLQFDSFPPGWIATLHVWLRVVAPDDDGGVRVLGLVVGIALAAVTFLGALEGNGRPPVVVAVLFLASASVVRYGDAIRGYGLGLVAGAACIWALHRFATRGDARSFVLAVALATIAVQLMFQNAVIVLASCVAAATVFAFRRSLRHVALSFAVGGVAALSLASAVPMMRDAAGWIELLRFDIDLGWLYSTWQETIAASGWTAIATWMVLLLVGSVSIFALIDQSAPSRCRCSPSGIFHATLLVVGTGAYAIFLVVLSYATAPWYYLALMLLQAVAMDGLFAHVLVPRTRFFVSGLLLVSLLFSFQASREYVSARATNVDLAAAAVATIASPEDLVIVSPWEIGMSLERHLEPHIRWQTVPPLGTVRWHRWDLVLEATRSPESTLALAREVTRTLDRKHRVFLVVNDARRPVPPPRVPEQSFPTQMFFTSLERARCEIVPATALGPGGRFETVSLLEVLPDATDRYPGFAR